MSKTYIESTVWCPYCDTYTDQEMNDSEHERDSSHDTQKCLECDSEYRWFTWHDRFGNLVE